MAASVLKYPGSKWNVAAWIIEHLPPQLIEEA
jgi:site-specific DNA-adenine methylase